MLRSVRFEGKEKNTQRGLWLSLAAFFVLIFLGANAHLFYVAFSSQPNCVEHTKVMDESGRKFRAAKSGC